MRLFEQSFRRLPLVLALLVFFSSSIFAAENGIVSVDEPSSGATVSHVVMHVAPLVNLDGNWGFEADFHVRFDIGFFYMGFGLLPKFEELSEYSNFKAYPEGFIGGGKGISMGIEYHIPVDKAKRFFVYPFFDWGTIGGDIGMENRTLMSAGIGLEARYKHLYSTLTVGFPFKKDFYDDKVSSARVDFSMSAIF